MCHVLVMGLMEEQALMSMAERLPYNYSLNGGPTMGVSSSYFVIDSLPRQATTALR